MKSNLTEEEREQVMKMFPGCPTRDEDKKLWLMTRKYIFFETGGRNRRSYFCPMCGRYEARRTPTTNPFVFDYFHESFDFHHKDSFVCPRCGFSGTLISVGMARGMNSLSTEEKVVILRERDGWCLLEAGYVRVNYSPNELNPEPDWELKARYAFKKGKRQKWAMRYGWDSCYHKYLGTLAQVKEVTEPFPVISAPYYGVTDDGSYGLIGGENIEKTELRYSMFVPLAERLTDYRESEDGWSLFIGKGAVSYLSEYTGKPGLEILAKVGRSDVCGYVWNGEKLGNKLNFKAKTPWGIFKITKTAYKAAGELRSDDIIELRQKGMDIRTAAAWKAVLGESLTSFAVHYGQHRSAGRIVKWMGEQELCPAYRTREARYAYWTDMLKMEEQLGNNTTHEKVMMPSSLRERHDEALEQLNELRRQQKLEEIEAAAELYKKRKKKLQRRYAYTDGTLSIIVPDSRETVEREGDLLKHCVDGYAERHIKGIKTILFLRWADDPDVPYMTVELDEKKTSIVQIHGFKNDRYSMSPWEIHGEFLAEWLAWIRAGSLRDKRGNPVIRKEKTA